MRKKSRITSEKSKIDNKKSNAKLIILLQSVKEDFSFVIILLYYNIYIKRSFSKKHMEKNKKLSPCIHEKSTIQHHEESDGKFFFKPIADGKSFLIFPCCFFYMRLCFFSGQLCFFI